MVVNDGVIGTLFAAETMLAHLQAAARWLSQQFP